jgi:hypothetical protein
MATNTSFEWPWSLHSGDPDVMQFSRSSMHSDLHAYATQGEIPNSIQDTVRMALCRECSPAVQEVPGSIPYCDITFTVTICRGCRWPVYLWRTVTSSLNEISGVFYVFYAFDMNGRSQIQGGKNWSFPKEIKPNRFFWDSHWLKIWKKTIMSFYGTKWRERGYGLRWD